MTTLNLAKVLSAEYVIGLLIALALGYATFTAWQAKANSRFDSLEKAVEVYREDHDALIRLQSDVAAIKESVQRIERSIGVKKEATIGIQ